MADTAIHIPNVTVMHITMVRQRYLPNGIRAVRTAMGMTIEQLAALAEADYSTVQRLETGSMGLTLDWAARIANALRVDIADLFTTGARPTRSVPIVGRIAAGAWREAIATPDGYLPLPDATAGPNAFALQVAGDSMDRVLPESSFAIVDPDQIDLIAGSVYAVTNGDGEATIKRFALNPLRLEPDSTNAEHQPILIGRTPFSVIGRVTMVIRPL